MERAKSEAVGLRSPAFADELVGGQAFQRLEPPAEVVGDDEVGEMPFELCVIVVVVAPDGRVLDGAVHAFDLAVSPRMRRLCQAMLDVEIGAGRLEGVAAEGHALGPHRLDVFWRPAIPGGLGEVGAVVRQYDVDLIGNGLGEVTQEVACDAPGRLPVQLDEGELGRPVDGDQQVKPAFGRLHLGDVDMEEADRVDLELLLRGLFAVDVGQAPDAVALQAAVQ